MNQKTVFIVVGVFVVSIVGWICFKAASAPLPDGFPPPTPAGKIEVKHYPAYRAGTYTYQGTLGQAANQAFEPLFQHIRANGIGMTAPVEARYPSFTLKELPTANSDDNGQAEVSFLYRNPKVQPQQVSPGIKDKTYPAMTVVSIGVRGPYTYASYQQNLVRLQDWLKLHPQTVVAGLPRRFFYDSPFVPDLLKRSEVQVPIR